MSQSNVARPSPRHLQALSQADFASVTFLVIFVALVFLFDRLFRPSFTPLSLVLTGLIMSIIPAVIWIGFFYRRDRLEPEPKHMIVRSFLLGGLIASAAGLPLINGLFDAPNWLYETPAAHFVGGILVVGFIHEFLKYAAVRFSVYNTAEFDEPVDGVIYSTAVGVGYATMLNIYFIVESGGADLGLAALRIVITALAHASFSGITGFFLGTYKFDESKPLWWVPAGVSLAALVNGFFFYLRGELSQASANMVTGSANQWTGLILAILLTIGVTYQLVHAIESQMMAETEGETA